VGVGGKEMFFEQLVEKRLREIIPDFDPNKYDRLLFITAQQDLKYYLQVKWNLEEFSSQNFSEQFLKYLAEEGTRIKVFIDGWLDSWYKAWKKQVTVILEGDHRNNDKFQASKMVEFGSTQLGLAQNQEFIRPLVEVLVNCKQIVCLDFIMASIIRKLKKRPTRTVKDKIEFTNKIMSHVRAVTEEEDIKVYIKIKNSYFR